MSPASGADPLCRRLGPGLGYCPREVGQAGLPQVVGASKGTKGVNERNERSERKRGREGERSLSTYNPLSRTPNLASPTLVALRNFDSASVGLSLDKRPFIVVFPGPAV